MKRKPSGATLIFGTARVGEYESLRDAGVPLALLADSGGTFKPPESKDFRLVKTVDFSSGPAAILDAGRALARELPVASVLNLIEFYVAPAADLSAALGLRGISPETARVCLSKPAMRERFIARIGPDSTAAFARIDNERDLADFARRTGFPIILKPGNLYASLFVTRCETWADLRDAYRTLPGRIEQHFRERGEEGEVVIQAEEFLTGSNHSVDCVVFNGKIYPTPVVDVLTGKDIGHDDFFHFSRVAPSALSADAQSALVDLAGKGAKAVGIENGVAHVELILTPKGPRLLEIGARPGGNRSRLLDLAFGLDLIGAYNDTLLGRRPRLNAPRSMPTAIISPFPRSAGRFAAAVGLKEVEGLASFKSYQLKAKLGALIGPASAGHLAACSIELQNPDPVVLEHDIRRIGGIADFYAMGPS